MNDSERVAAEMRVLTIIGASLMGGVATLTGIVWYLLTFGGFVTFDLPRVASQAALGVFLLSLPLAPLLRGKVDPPDPDGSPAEIAGRYRAGAIVAFAVREGAGLIGILASLLVGAPNWVLGYGGATLLVMAFGWPSAAELRARLRPVGTTGPGMTP